uniref:Autophagy-related protein 16 domain-containing protein n=2 Tax=Kalmanozyma brasiliensis (strain GHG001) TaxID=1365824 RepID=V5F078_KALBG
MSAKTRSRLKKALRESLNLEAHFASIRLGSNSNDDVLAEKLTADRSGRDEPKQKDEELLRAGSAKVDSNDMRKSISAMLLTEDDRYLDELVSAVARIGLEDLAPESSPSDGPADVEAEPASSAHPLEPAGAPSKSSAANSAVQAELSAALLELDTLRTQLQLSQTHTSSLEAQIAQHTASTARTARTQAILEADLAALKGEMAGVEWDKAKTDWARVRVEVLAELEDAKVQKDAMLVLGSQMGMWERMIRART